MMSSDEETDSSEPERPTHNAGGHEIPWAAFEADSRRRLNTDETRLWKVDCRCEAEPHWTADPAEPNIWYIHWHHDHDCPAMKIVMAFNN
jgi:hypothetical protein